MTHVWGKFCGFIQYNVQCVVFIVIYITLKWQIDIRQKIYIIIKTSWSSTFHFLESFQSHNWDKVIFVEVLNYFTMHVKVIFVKEKQ
jgi:hypothetical protein